MKVIHYAEPVTGDKTLCGRNTKENIAYIFEDVTCGNCKKILGEELNILNMERDIYYEEDIIRELKEFID